MPQVRGADIKDSIIFHSTAFVPAAQMYRLQGGMVIHMTYTIRQFAEMFHTTEHTLRYYTDIELLPCRRDDGNRRIFDNESVNWMRGITYLKSCGTPVKEIKRYCELCRMEESEENLRARYEIIRRQQNQAHRKLAEAQAAAEYMDHKLKHYEDILAGRIPDDTNPGNWIAGAAGCCGS